MPDSLHGGQPLVLVFHPTRWDPATTAFVETYNRIVARVPGPGGARLLAIEGRDDATRLRFADDALPIGLLEAPAELARRFDVGPDGGVVVLDGRGRVRARHVAADGPLPTPDALADALAAAADSATEPTSGWSRRDFVATVLGASVALAVLPRPGRAAPPTAAAPVASVTPRTPPPDAVPVTLRVNGRDLALTLEPRVTLLDALREYAGLTGTKKGCDHGQCGACTVHVDGRRTLACLTLAVMQQGHAITTIEGLAATTGRGGDALHPVQDAFIACDGFQCGYCTPGQIMSAAAVLREPWGTGDDEVREAMSGNICRCGAYPGIVAAVQQARGTATNAGEVRR